MAASVNNIAAAFSSARVAPATPTSVASSSSPPRSASSFSIVSSAGGYPISASWNPHSTLPISRRSSLISIYGAPGPKPSSFHLSAPFLSLARRRTTIAVGGRVPRAILSHLRDGTVHTLSTFDLFRSRKVVILGVPAAFAPRQWTPGELTAEGLVRRAGEMRERGAAVVACVSANDVFVMRAWGESIGASSAKGCAGGVMILSDPGARMAMEMGLAADFGGGIEGFGLRTKNYCVVVADGIVKALFLEDDGVGFDEVIRAI
ncbi:hypothetical protein HPP92_004472 [Vanilla planifolia]|uniref:glutaredoxin-dependent peroxiredoxin n=1 Tax=Vanilla planifolia TaxID=51239 RepID=A0A835VDN3_VANPL|nr:hypothetical protein HPP92_004472 [Vanilla planifolia]